jgi:predicted enzyme related to lactoylglutathione lyase
VGPHERNRTMLERDEYPTGVPCWIDLEVPDPDAAAAFYGGLFGWSFQSRAPESAPFRYLVGQVRGLDVAAIGSPSDDTGVVATWRTWVATASADDSVALVLAHGGEVLSPPTDIPRAGRSALCADPAGAVFGFWEPHGTPGARVVNEPGTWNFSNLATKDLEGAIAFYGAVAYWVARPVDLGGFTSVMLCRPGYGDWLAERDPSLRERHAQEGIPEGYSDIVAWLDEDTSGPPRWDVTFAVEDTDAVAARCTELGGAVVSPPATAGPTPVAVLRDPQGTTFTVSHYQP